MTGTRGKRESAAAAPPAIGRDVRLVLAGLLLTSLVSMLDQAVVATAGPTVVGELGGLTGYAWVFTAYMLAFSVTMPLYGKLGDLFGRKPVYLFAIVVFLIGSAACGAAQSMGQLIGFRALQGLGGGGLVVGAMAILGEILDPRSRAKYQGYLAAVFAFANLAGPLVGGVVTDQLGWRWVFYVNLPIGLLALGLAAGFLRTAKPRGRPRIDYLGAALLTGAVLSVVLIASWAGTAYAWGSPVVLGLAAAAILLAAGFVLAERRAADPVLPLWLFRDSTLDICVVVAFAGSFAFFGLINFLPLFLQLVSGTSATATGLLFVPAMLAVAVASTVAGQLIARTGRYKWLPVASMAVALLGTALLGTLSADTRPWVAAGYLAVVGLGMGLSQQVVTLAAQNTAPPEDLGVVTSTVGFLRNTGVWLGTAVFGGIVNARLAVELADRLPPGAVARLDVGSLTPERVGQLAPALRHGVAEAYAAALATGFGFVVPVLVAALVAAVLLRDLPLRPRGTGGPGGPGRGAGPARYTQDGPGRGRDRGRRLQAGHGSGGRHSPAGVEPVSSTGGDDRA